jgi:hypothetical protein
VGSEGTLQIYLNIICYNTVKQNNVLLLYIIVTGVCSECNIFVCYLCTGNWCIFIVFVMFENTDITWYYILPVDCNIFVSLWCSVLVIKSQSMKQLM